MEVTRLQGKTLEAYQDLRRHNGSVVGQFRCNVRIYISLLIRAAIALPFTYLIDETLGLFVLGFVIAIVVRDMQQYFQRKRTWPVIAGILDWPRIDELLHS